MRVSPYGEKPSSFSPSFWQTILEKLQNLQNLHLGNTQVQDLKPIEKLHNLQSLHLGDTQVQDLEPIEKLHNLQYLDLRATRVDEQAVQDLRDKRPHLHILGV